MRVIPAVDLLGGRCVQLRGGDPAAKIAEEADAVARARAFADAGAGLVHLVDLDAALGSGDNAALVSRIVRGAGVAVQVGGGVRTSERLDVLLAEGASRVIVGTRGVLDPVWFDEVVTERPGRVVLALDCAKGRVVVRGWKKSTPLALVEAASRVDGLPLGGILFTSVDKEGRLGGPDTEGLATLVAATPHDVLYSGGIATMEHLDAVADAGAAGVIVGAALYTGRLDLAKALERFKEERT